MSYTRINNTQNQTNGWYGSGPRTPFCLWCKNAGEERNTFTSHNMRDMNGCTTCPALLATQCSYCHENGHVKSHCPHLAKNHSYKGVGHNFIPRARESHSLGECITLVVEPTPKKQQVKVVIDPDDDGFVNVSSRNSRKARKSKAQTPVQQIESMFGLLEVEPDCEAQDNADAVVAQKHALDFPELPKAAPKRKEHPMAYKPQREVVNAKPVIAVPVIAEPAIAKPTKSVQKDIDWWEDSEDDMDFNKEIEW